MKIRKPFRECRSIDRPEGFTLVEMMSVIALISVLMVMALPIVMAMKDRKLETVFFEVADSVEMARSYAMANGTYVYLGIAEYDVTKPVGGPQTPGKGRVVVAAVASRDGTRGYADTSAANAATSWQSSYSNGANLISLAPVQVYENVHLAPLGTPPASGNMARPNPGNDAWRLGSDSFKQESQTPFSLPLGSSLNGGKYNFNQVLIFLPNGSICRQTSYSGIGQAWPLWMEIGIEPTQGVTTNFAAISINGTTGTTKIYRP